MNSASKVRLITLVNGKPQGGVKIKVYARRAGTSVDEEEPRASLVSNRRGEVHLPKLSPGAYHILASAGENLTANLYLNVVAHSTQEVSGFPMDLTPQYSAREKAIANAERMAIQDWVKEFRGTVYDATGAVFPDVYIEVFRKGTGGKDRVAQLNSGTAGEFSAKLPEGSYIAFFSARGFQTRVVPFEVTNVGVDELKITLEAASVAQGVAVDTF